MNNISKRVITFVCLIALLFQTGCTVLTHRVGHEIDRGVKSQVAQYENPDDSVVLCVNEEVVVTLKNGAVYAGRVSSVFEEDDLDVDLLIDTSDGFKSVAFDEIALIQIYKNPTMARCLCTSVGVIADSYILIGMISNYLFINAMSNMR